jgi:hypothetical protein
VNATWRAASTVVRFLFPVSFLASERDSHAIQERAME